MDVTWAEQAQEKGSAKKTAPRSMDFPHAGVAAGFLKPFIRLARDLCAMKTLYGVHLTAYASCMFICVLAWKGHDIYSSGHCAEGNVFLNSRARFRVSCVPSTFHGALGDRQSTP